MHIFSKFACACNSFQEMRAHAKKSHWRRKFFKQSFIFFHLFFRVWTFLWGRDWGWALVVRGWDCFRVGCFLVDFGCLGGGVVVLGRLLAGLESSSSSSEKWNFCFVPWVWVVVGAACWLVLSRFKLKASSLAFHCGDVGKIGSKKVKARLIEFAAKFLNKLWNSFCLSSKPVKTITKLKQI